MVKWAIEFFPPEGENYSPADTLKNITLAIERARIMRALGVIMELEPWEWPRWVKLVDNIYQVTAHNHRVYFYVVDRKLIVCHICRKVSQKAQKGDLDRAKKNFLEYKKSIK